MSWTRLKSHFRVCWLFLYYLPEKKQTYPCFLKLFHVIFERRTFILYHLKLHLSYNVLLVCFFFNNVRGYNCIILWYHTIQFIKHTLFSFHYSSFVYYLMLLYIKVICNYYIWTHSFRKKKHILTQIQICAHRLIKSDQTHS